MVNAIRVALTVLVLAMPLLWAMEWLAGLRALVALDQFALAVLTASLALVFLTSKKGAVGRIRQLLALASLVVGGFALYGIDEFALRIFMGGPSLFILSCALTGLCVTACYFVTGWPMTMLVVGFIVFGAVARLLPAPINAPAFDLDTYVVYIAFGGDALVGEALRIVTAVVSCSSCSAGCSS